MTLLPDDLMKDAPPAVLDARERLADALEADEQAATAEREARVALAAAPVEDEARTREAVAKGKPTPALTRPKREAEAEAATRRADVTRDLASEAARNFASTIRQHRDELATVQAPRVDALADEVMLTLDLLAEQLERFGAEAGVLHGLYRPAQRGESQAAERMRARGGRAPVELPSFSPLGVPSVPTLRDAVEELRTNAVPMSQRILSAVGDGTIAWEDVAANLGISPVDDAACQARGWLVDEKALEYCDSNGDRIVPGSVMSGAGVVVVQKRLLRRVASPPLSPTQAARAAARQAA